MLGLWPTKGDCTQGLRSICLYVNINIKINLPMKAVVSNSCDSSLYSTCSQFTHWDTTTHMV